MSLHSWKEQERRFASMGVAHTRRSACACSCARALGSLHGHMCMHFCAYHRHGRAGSNAFSSVCLRFIKCIHSPVPLSACVHVHVFSTVCSHVPMYIPMHVCMYVIQFGNNIRYCCIVNKHFRFISISICTCVRMCAGVHACTRNEEVETRMNVCVHAHIHMC